MQNIRDLDDEKLKKVSAFFGKLVLTGLIVRTIMLLSLNTYALESTLASVSGALLTMFGVSVETLGNRIVAVDALFIVNQDCLGWKSISAFLGLSWASKKHYNYKILLLGIAGLIILNIIRIVTTISLSTSGIISFEALHLFLWRWGLTAAVFLFWIINMKIN